MIRNTHPLQRISVLEKKLFASPLHKDPRLPELYELYAQKQEATALVKSIKKRIQTALDVLQLDELKCRKRVLRRLGFTTNADVIEMKGRVACEISTGDELLLTEMIFNGVFNNLLPEQCAALLSCFVFTEKVCKCIVCSICSRDRLLTFAINRASKPQSLKRS